MRAGVIFRGLAMIRGDFDAESRANPARRSHGGELREATDHAEDVLVDEEVLAELLLRADAHRPNA